MRDRLGLALLGGGGGGRLRLDPQQHLGLMDQQRPLSQQAEYAWQRLSHPIGLIHQPGGGELPDPPGPGYLQLDELPPATGTQRELRCRQQPGGALGSSPPHPVSTGCGGEAFNAGVGNSGWRGQAELAGPARRCRR